MLAMNLLLASSALAFDFGSLIPQAAQPAPAPAAAPAPANPAMSLMKIASLAQSTIDPSNPIATITNLAALPTKDPNAVKDITDAVEQLTAGGGAKMLEQLMGMFGAQGMDPMQALGTLQMLGVVSAEDVQQVTALKGQLRSFVCTNTSVVSMLTADNEAENAAEGRKRVINGLRSATTDLERAANGTDEKWEEFLNSPGFNQVVDEYKVGMAHLFDEIPTQLISMVSANEQKHMRVLNDSLVLLMDDAVDTVVSLMKSEIPMPDNAIAHLKAAAGSTEKMVSEVGQMVGLPLPELHSEEMVANDLSKVSASIYDMAAQVKSEDLVQVLDVMLGKKPGNRIDAMQTLLRSSVKAYQQAALASIDRTKLRLGQDSSSFQTLFGRVAAKLSNRTRTVYAKAQAATPDQAKKDLSMFLDQAGADMVARSLHSMSLKLSGLMVELIESISKEGVNSVAAAAESAVSELSGGAQGSLPDQASAIVNKTAMELIAALSSPAKSTKSYKELQQKVHDVLKARLLGVSSKTQSKFFDALETVWAKFDEGVMKVKSTFATELSSNLALVATDLGFCNQGLYPNGKK